MSRFTSLALLASLALAPACKNDSGTGPSNPVPVASVTLDRTSVTLAKGDQTRLTATPRDANGNPLSGRTAEWTSSDATVVSVTPAGVVTALRAETATVTATVEGKSATATVTVRVEYVYDLIHSGWPDWDWRLFRTPLDGGPTEPIIPPDVMPDFGFNRPAVSPDGRRIAFEGWQTYTPNLSYVFVVNADGSDVRQLTTGGSERQPAWSPDGTRIAYVVRPKGEQWDIWVMNADGTDPVNLTGAMGNAKRASPAWSSELPGGSRIVFGEGDATYFNLWTMRPDGSDRRQVTTGKEWWDDDPSWSPDGSRIAFMREGPGTENDFEIWVVDATGANATVLVDLPDSQSFPAWSPDGRLIAFTSSHEGPFSPFVIYTVQSDGTGLTRRTHQPWWSNQPTWDVRP